MFADFIKFSGTNFKVCLLSGWIGTRYQIQAFRYFLEIFLFFRILNQKSQLEDSLSVDNSLVPFHLW